MSYHELQDQSVEEFLNASGGQLDDEDDELDFPEQDDAKLEEVEKEDEELEEEEDSPEKPNGDDE